ncbi:hypothetical protein RB620_11675 [Paenibacillus sp. LHD-117]|uniref:hypothetical protein n=1 Tax=Paenibacillus sp. LHD-117 TaxID=3071412 RepID=UPI0027E1A764|nr:hypothetical protein [Paenibacillus sp. LHD-117]MDQ6420096.1 hypothetical protein [Paenibacillus sp. LHD-117]
MKFKPIDQGKRVQDPSSERKSLVEMRMEMIALLLSRRSEGGTDNKKKADATLTQS